MGNLIQRDPGDRPVMIDEPGEWLGRRVARRLFGWLPFGRKAEPLRRKYRLKSFLKDWFPDEETLKAVEVVEDSLVKMFSKGYLQAEQLTAWAQLDTRHKDLKAGKSEAAAGLGLTRDHAEVLRVVAQGEGFASFIVSKPTFSGVQIRRLARYFDETGVTEFGFPVNRVASIDDMLFHTMATRLGVSGRARKPAKQDGEAFYQVYSFNDPYLVRGYLEIKRKAGDAPQEVMLYQGWRNAANKYFGETYRGFLIAKDYNSYMVLFNEDKAANDLNRMRILCLEGSVAHDGFFEKLRGSGAGFGSVDIGGPVSQEVVMYREPMRVEDYQSRTAPMPMVDDYGNVRTVHTPYYREFHIEEEIPVVAEKEKWVKVFNDLNLDITFEMPRRAEGIVIQTGENED